MKVDALRLASKSPGVDSTSTSSELKQAQSALDAINKLYNEEVNAINADEQKKIDAVRGTAAAGVDKALREYADLQNDRIQRGAKTARDETIAELCPTGSAAQAGVNVGKSAGWTGSQAGAAGSGAADLRNRIALLEERIRADLSRAVVELARQKGVVVMFSRSSDKIPDETQVYYRLLQERPLSDLGPVITDTQGT